MRAAADDVELLNQQHGKQRSNQDIEPPYHQDLFPHCCFDDASRRLAAMAQTAWAFGGMGSWNDLGFPDRTIHIEYEQLTGDLFATVMLACLASTNTTMTATA